MCRCIRLIEYRISYVEMYVLRFDLRTYCVGFEKYNVKLFFKFIGQLYDLCPTEQSIYICMYVAEHHVRLEIGR